MKLYIPTVGDELRLTADWTFDLWNEYRNKTLMEITDDPRKVEWRDITALPCTIPAGEILKVDRIYIRKGAEDFDSITFLWKGMRTDSRIEERTGRAIYEYGNYQDFKYEKKISAKPVRFWVKLPDANKIEFEPV